jgi:hypothetical protein
MHPSVPRFRAFYPAEPVEIKLRHYQEIPLVDNLLRFRYPLRVSELIFCSRATAFLFGGPAGGRPRYSDGFNAFRGMG